MIRSSQAKILTILLKFKDEGIFLVKPSKVRNYILVYEPHTFSSFDSARRNVRYNLNNLSDLGLLERRKLTNSRLLFSLTPKGEELAKELV